jgi:DNA polymerase-3 subunit epsilon
MKRFAYLDIEATHTNWHDAEIIEIAFIIKDENGKELDFFHSLIKPQKQLSEEITLLTGITSKMLDNSPEFHKVAQTIFDKLHNTTIVAHKAKFDCELLTKAFSPLELTPNIKKVCTLELAKRLIPGLRSYSLKALCDLLQISLKNNHRALSDASVLYEIHTYLKLINGHGAPDQKHEKKFLNHHRKIITKSPQRPGVIVIKYENKNKEVYKTENLNQKLQELFKICAKNKHRLLKSTIEIIPSASLIEAGLIQTKIEKPFYPFCIYKIKNKQGKLILKIGRTNIKKQALYFTKSKSEANQIIKNLTKDTRGPKLAYEDSSKDQSDILKENLQLLHSLKKIVSTEKNVLIRSTHKLNGKYHYTLIKGNKSFANFKTDTVIKNSDDLSCVQVLHKIHFRPMNPREYMSLNHSLKWIKNQKSKTDHLLEIKIKFN